MVSTAIPSARDSGPKGPKNTSYEAVDSFSPPLGQASADYARLPWKAHLYYLRYVQQIVQYDVKNMYFM